jgi:cullin 1
MSDRDAEQCLHGVISIFEYISEKDVFANFYRLQLASRLLKKTSANDEAERKMILLLKSKQGTGYTATFEGMFKGG